MQGAVRSSVRSEDTDVYKIIEPMELEKGEYVPSKKPSLRLGVNVSQQEGTLEKPWKAIRTYNMVEQL